MAYRAFFDEHRTFGVEFEVYGVSQGTLAAALGSVGLSLRSSGVYTAWKIGDDSSIQGRMPAEVRSPILSGREGLEQVMLATAALRLVGCKVNESCGFHVHWNCADYTGKNALSLLRLYTKFEGVIDFLVAPSRRGNTNKHCRSMVKDSDLNWIAELDKTERKRASEVATRFSVDHIQVVNNERRSSRYHKLNISAYNSYGTMEFRQHQGTVSSEKAINWIVFTQQLVNKAKYVSVSKQVSAKPTLGEMLRVLKLVDHHLIENQCTDLLILELGTWLKKRYVYFKGGADE